MTGTKRICCVGECMVEFFRTGPETWRQGFAGDTLNVAWATRAVAPADLHIDYVSRVGTDAVSGEMCDFIGAAGIGTDHIQRDPARTVGLYTIATDDDGERSFSYWRSSSAARGLADTVEALDDAFQGASLIYLSGITTAILGEAGRTNLIAALTKARAAGARVAYDPNYRPALWESETAMRAASDDICSTADILLPTYDDEAAAHGDANPEATAARLSALGCPEIVVKDGPAPVLLCLNGQTEWCPVPDQVQPLDTTGAGDSFNGGYLSARAEQLAPVEAVRRGQRVAARVVQSRGALVPMQTLRDAALT